MKELNEMELREVEGGFLPLLVIGVIYAVQLCCCVVALGMQARLNQEQ